MINALFVVKDSLELEVLLAINYFATVLQVFKSFHLLTPLQYLFAPFIKLILFVRMEANYWEGMKQRIQRQISINHLDFFSFALSGKGTKYQSPRRNSVIWNP